MVGDWPDVNACLSEYHFFSAFVPLCFILAECLIVLKVAVNN
jgi:hypothetical protein